MRKKALVVLAQGFEEIEAVTPIDVLRRAGVEVIIAGVGQKEVSGSRGVKIVADVLLETVAELPDAIVLPGGSPGAENLKRSKALMALLERMKREKKWIAAICAAPGVVLAPQGLLSGKKATAYPGYEKSFPADACFTESRVVKDDGLITSRGPGTALEFSLALVAELVDTAMAEKLASMMLVPAVERGGPSVH